MTEKDRIEIEMAKEEAERFRREMQKSGERTVSPNASQEPINTVEALRTYGEIKSSTDQIDRTAYFINGLSPHNLWKAKATIDTLIIQARWDGAVEAVEAYLEVLKKDRITALESQLGKK